MKAFLSTLACIATLVCGPVRAEPVTVFAAASLQGALEEIATLYPQDLRVSYGGSGAMARQVAGGAPADVILLAHPKWMDWLADQTAIPLLARRDFAGNRLVVIGGPNAPDLTSDNLAATLQHARLAIAQHQAVPAGQYAAQWLRAQKLWEPLRAKLVETDNVRAALALVATGAVPYGVVYITDAKAEPRVRVLYEIEAHLHDPITYPAAARTPKGSAFLTFLSGPKATDILARHGFQRPPA